MLRSFEVKNQYIFVMACPTVFVYYASFNWLNQKKITLPYIQSDNSEPEQKNVPLNMKSINEILPKAFPLIRNLFTVYFLEYCILGCFIDRMQMRVQSRDGGVSTQNDKNYFLILSICYQIGVFFSRSSLSFIQIKAEHIWILTAL